jgi:pimeloyl-ACP methyl ester carboxylesterase
LPWLALALVLAVPPPAHAAGAVRSADGVPIAYTVQGRGTPALVFVHCWACDHSFWDGQVPHFAQTHQVVTLDLGGHGRSGSARKDWTMGAFAEDVAAVVRHLGLEKVVLIGHSMGGPVILEAARRLPDRVVGLVPVDTLLDVEDPMTAQQIDGIVAGFQADFKGSVDRFARGYMFVPASSPALIDDVVRKAQSMDPAIALSAIRNTWAYDAREPLRQTRVPIVAVNADKFPTDLAGARRHAPQYDAVIVKGWGHYLMREDPAGFNRALEEALRRIAR